MENIRVLGFHTNNRMWDALDMKQQCKTLDHSVSVTYVSKIKHARHNDHDY
jgi:hypothetical protein